MIGRPGYKTSECAVALVGMVLLALLPKLGVNADPAAIVGGISALGSSFVLSRGLAKGKG